MEDGKIELSIGAKALPKESFIIQDKSYGERLFVIEGDTYREATKEPLKPIRTHADRKYTMHNSQSFINSVVEYGDSDDGIIFYELLPSLQNGVAGIVTMFFEEDNRKESITLPLTRSLEFRSFLNGKDKSFSQKDFLKLIETFPECFEYSNTLKPNVERLQMNAAIDFESNIDPDNLVFIYQEKGGSQSGKLPRKLLLTMPYFEGSKNTVEIDADLEITMPKEENAKPVFKLINVKHERTEREAMDKEIDTLEQALTGWIFVNGKF